jgi:molybdopterin-containing oxidoreductase family membrane subunit
MRKRSKKRILQHIELMNIVIMITGSIVGVAYKLNFIAWYSGVEYEYAF